MGNPLDRILVIDVEATCWEGDPPPDQEREIIEIGLCILDVATGARGEHMSIVLGYAISGAFLISSMVMSS